MYVDSHVHLQPHGEAPPLTRERIEEYLAVAEQRGVARLAFTEHLFRFREAFEVLYGWWEADPDPTLAATARAYWEDHATLSIGDYVREIERAKADGLPVLLGLEMDWLPGKADELRRFLEPYDWDIVLGSIHWIGSWGFDSGHGIDREEWEQRDIDQAFAQYAALLRELASTGLCDVLAHPDLPKLFGHRPPSLTPLHDAIVEAAAEAKAAVELNSNGWNKPCAEAYPAPPVIERARAAGLPITLASDAHRPERVGEQFDGLAALASDAGYDSFQAFEARRPAPHPLPSAARK